MEPDRKVKPANHMILSCLATAAMGYPEQYRADYGHIMQAVLDLDRRIDAENIRWSREEYNESMYRYGIWKRK